MNATNGSLENNIFGSLCLYTSNMWKLGVVQAKVSILVCELNRCICWIYGIFIKTSQLQMYSKGGQPRQYMLYEYKEFLYKLQANKMSFFSKNVPQVMHWCPKFCNRSWLWELFFVLKLMNEKFLICNGPPKERCLKWKGYLCFDIDHVL